MEEAERRPKGREGTLRPFEFIKVGIKGLWYVARLPQPYKLTPPRYQFSARDARTDGVCYAYRRIKDLSRMPPYLQDTYFHSSNIME